MRCWPGRAANVRSSWCPQILSARALLRRQAQGRRCVALLDDEAARAHGDPRHPDGLSFALHDLCHLEKFVAPEHHHGQIGFFRAVDARAGQRRGRGAGGDLRRDLERRARLRHRRHERLGGLPVLGAEDAAGHGGARRRCAAARRTHAPRRRRAVSTPHERAALLPVLEIWFAGMGLPAALRSEALAVSARRDQPGARAAAARPFRSGGGRGSIFSTESQFLAPILRSPLSVLAPAPCCVDRRPRKFLMMCRRVIARTLLDGDICLGERRDGVR